jgi:hypothetical protein
MLETHRSWRRAPAQAAPHSGRVIVSSSLSPGDDEPAALQVGIPGCVLSTEQKERAAVQGIFAS